MAHISPIEFPKKSFILVVYFNIMLDKTTLILIKTIFEEHDYDKS